MSNTSSTPPPTSPAAQPQMVQVPIGYRLVPGNSTNVLAIIALVTGIMVPVAGIICGHIAVRQISRTGESGHGMALAGLIIGYVLTGLYLLFAVAYIVFFAAFITFFATHGMQSGMTSGEFSS